MANTRTANKDLSGGSASSSPTVTSPSGGGGKKQFLDRKKQYRDDHQTPPLDHPSLKHAITLLSLCIVLLAMLGLALYGMQLAVPWSPLSTDAEAIFECLIPRIDVQGRNGWNRSSTTSAGSSSSNPGGNSASSSGYPGEEYGKDEWEFVNVSCEGHIGSKASRYSSSLVVDNSTRSFLFHSSPASFSDGHYQGLFRGKIIVLVAGCLILASCPIVWLQSFRMRKRKRRKAANENSALLESGDEQRGGGSGMPRFFYYGTPPSPPLFLGCLALIGGQRTAETSFAGARKGRRYLRLWTASLFLVIILAFAVVVAFTALTKSRVTHCTARRCFSILQKNKHLPPGESSTTTDTSDSSEGHSSHPVNEDSGVKAKKKDDDGNNSVVEKEREVHCEDFSDEVCPIALTGYFIYLREKFHLALKREADLLTPEEKQERKREQNEDSSKGEEISGGGSDSDGSAGAHPSGKEHRFFRDVTSVFDPVPSRPMLTVSVFALTAAFLPLMFVTMFLWNRHSKVILQKQEQRAANQPLDDERAGGVKQALAKQYAFHGATLHQTLAASEQPRSESFSPPKSGESAELY